MNRRTFLGAVGIAGVSVVGGATGAAYALGDGNGDSEPDGAKPDRPSTPSQSVKRARPLAEAFYKRLSEHFESKVYITQEGEIVAEYETNAERREELEAEFSQLAVLYAETISEGEYEPVTLSLVVDSVQGIVPVTSLRAYITDDINKKAFLKTIEVKSVERTDS